MHKAAETLQETVDSRTWSAAKSWIRFHQGEEFPYKGKANYWKKGPKSWKSRSKARKAWAK